MAAKPVAELLKEKKIFQVVNPRLVQGVPSISVKDAIEVMQQNRSGYIVIVKEEKPIGIFTEVDVCNKVLGCKLDLESPVSELMTKEPFTLSPQASVGEAIKLMGDHHFYHIPLVDDQGKLAGVLSVRTLIRFLAEFYPTEVYNLPPSPDQIIESQEGG